VIYKHHADAGAVDALDRRRSLGSGAFGVNAGIDAWSTRLAEGRIETIARDCGSSTLISAATRPGLDRKTPGCGSHIKTAFPRCYWVTISTDLIGKPAFDPQIDQVGAQRLRRQARRAAGGTGSSHQQQVGMHGTSARGKAYALAALPPDNSLGVGRTRSRRDRSSPDRGQRGGVRRSAASMPSASRPSSTFLQHGEPGENRRERLKHHRDAVRRALDGLRPGIWPRRRRGVTSPRDDAQTASICPIPERPSRADRFRRSES